MYWTWTDTREILWAFLTPKRNWQNPRFRWDSIWIVKVWKLGRFLVENFSVSNTCQSLYVPQSTLKATEYTISYPTIYQATTEGGRHVFSPHFFRGESPTIWSLQRQQSQDNLTKAWHMSSLAGVSNRSTPHSLAFDNDSCCWNFLANSLPFPKYSCERCFQQMKAAKCFCRAMPSVFCAFGND